VLLWSYQTVSKGRYVIKTLPDHDSLKVPLCLASNIQDVFLHDPKESRGLDTKTSSAYTLPRRRFASLFRNFIAKKTHMNIRAEIVATAYVGNPEISAICIVTPPTPK
jgi:hypothetical protein